jgi:2-polyprenyl-3-methyl-5-hydroxy-6-metoxy-1,4-benzoquinol methylase
MRNAGRRDPAGPERPASDATGARVSEEFWNERNRRVSLRSIAPQPKRYYMDFELDRVFRRWLGPGSGRRLLEAGCGSSLWLPYFARRFGWDVAGLDYSDAGLAVSSEILRRNGVQGSLRKADLTAGPGEDRESFDAVFSLGLIEHFERPDGILAILKELVRPGGLLLTWIPNTAGWIPRLNPLLDRNYRGFYSRLDLAVLRDHHRALGLDVLQGTYVQFLDLNFLSLAALPSALQKPLALAFRGFGLFLMAMERAVSRPVQSRRLCAGIVVVARRPDKPARP